MRGNQKSGSEGYQLNRLLVSKRKESFIYLFFFLSKTYIFILISSDKNPEGIILLQDDKNPDDPRLFE